MKDSITYTARRLRLLPDVIWSRLPYHWHRRRYLTHSYRLVPDILAAIPPQIDTPVPPCWSIQSGRWSDVGVAIIMVGPPGRPAAVIKLPRTNEGAAALQRQKQVLRELHGDVRLAGWAGVLPVLLAEGEIAGQFYMVEQVLPGHDAMTVARDPAWRAQLHRAAQAAISQLHQRTAAAVMVDTALLKRWVDQPLLLLHALIHQRPYPQHYDRALQRLAAELHATLAGQTVCVSWIHGDYWPGNLLVGPDNITLTGILDWDRAAPGELPMHDVLHLLLYTRQLVQPCDLGDLAQELLEGVRWMPYERNLLDAAVSTLPGTPVNDRAMVLLWWLRHVAANLVQSTTYMIDPLWVKKNVEGVLRHL